jgi:hypothetical protein
MGFDGEIVSIVVHETPSLTSVGFVGVAFGLAEEEGFHVTVDLVEDGAIIGFPRTIGTRRSRSDAQRSASKSFHSPASSMRARFA